MYNKTKPKAFCHFAPRKGFGISRIDQPDKCTHGWYLRLSYAGIRWFFADGKHGGKKGALEACERSRDTQMLSYPKALQLKASLPRKKKTVKKGVK